MTDFMITVEDQLIKVRHPILGEVALKLTSDEVTILVMGHEVVSLSEEGLYRNAVCEETMPYPMDEEGRIIITDLEGWL